MKFPRNVTHIPQEKNTLGYQESVMQGRNLNCCIMFPKLFNHEPYYLSWHDTTSYGDTDLYGESLSFSQDTTGDDSLYMTSKDHDWSWYNNRETNQDHGEKEKPQNNMGTWFGDYAPYSRSTWEENEVSEAYEGSMETEGDVLYQGHKHWDYYRDNYNKEQDYPENQEHRYGSFCLAGDSWDGIFRNLENLHYSSRWDDWELEETILCERLLGH